jgi:peptidoglycan hydrolase CwlO-like protein
LETLYQTISNELNTVLHDVNYKTFHDNIISIELDITNSLNGKKLKYDVRNLEYLVTSVFDKLIQFLGELKFDYLNSKEQNMKFLTENISRNANLSDNMASMNAEVSKMQRKVNEQDEIINRLESENNLLKCQIELIEKKSH